MSEDVRKLVRIVNVDDVQPAENADALEISTVGAWEIVTRKGVFRKGDRAVFAEIDAAIPVDDERFGLPAHEAKDFGDGVNRLVIKTIRLRGNLSQGVLFPLALFPELEGVPNDVDVSGSLGITKYEPEKSVSNDVVGEWNDRFAIRSDAERVQNLAKFYDQIKAEPWIATEKVDGESMTVVNDGGTLRVYGRQAEFKPETSHLNDVLDADFLLNHLPQGWSIQGEAAGPKIQSNKLGLDKKRFFLFNVFNTGRPVPRDQWENWMNELSVPVIENFTLPDTAAELVGQVDGMKSIVNPEVLAEGVVFHHKEGKAPYFLSRPSFKVISNAYLSNKPRRRRRKKKK